VTELIAAVDAVDMRFPASRELDGAGCSATYVTVRTSDGREGFGVACTVGRGNEITVAAVRALAPLVIGLPVAEVFADLGVFSARLTRDSQPRWLGHLAAAAVVDAVWDLRARSAGEPVRVATGAHTHNVVMFKQLLRAGAVDVLRIDASRVAGITENVAILLLAARFGVPVCPNRMHPESVARYQKEYAG
jgi:L-alanine-DL-glutamate epimerase-like enolase superfamily enzyme